MSRTHATHEPEATRPTPESPAPKAEEPKAAAPSPIIKQGTAPPNAAVEKKIDPELAGQYEVIHGSITFGPGQVAFPGAIVNLSAEDASTALAAGAVKRH